MSHTTKLQQLEITNKKALKRAVQILNRREGGGYEYKEHAVPRLYSHNQHGACEVVISVNGRDGYDIGLERGSNGKYNAVTDNWRSNTSKNFGSEKATTANGKVIGKLLQAYAEAATIMAAEARGYTVNHSSVDSRGVVHVEIQCA